MDARSLYARPFPMDATVDTITELFNGHGTVNCVRMRRHVRSKMFKGSVFVEFSSVEEAEKVRERGGGEKAGRTGVGTSGRRGLEERLQASVLAPCFASLRFVVEADAKGRFAIAGAGQGG